MNREWNRMMRDIALMAVTAAAAALIGSHAAQVYQQWKGPGRGGNFAQHLANQPQRLTLYGTTTCPACISAREYLRSSQIPFNDQLIDKSTEAKKMYAMLGENSVPVLVAEDKMLVGFNSKAYSEMAEMRR